MRYFFSLVLIGALLLGGASQAFEFPKIAGADEAEFEAALSGDFYAATSYVIPLLNDQELLPETSDKLIAWLEYSYAGFEELGDNDASAWVANALAGHLWPRNELYSALEWAQRCYTRSSDGTDRSARLLTASCLETAGLVAVSMQRTDEAIEWLGHARYLYSALYDDLQEPWILTAIANVLTNEGTALDAASRHSEAVGLYQDSLRVIESIEEPDSVSAAYAILNIGASYWYAKDFEPAREWSLRGLPLIDRHEGPLSGAATITRLNLALIEYDLGNPEGAMNWAIEVLPYIAAHPQRSLDHQRWTFELLRRIFADSGEVERAILFGKLAVNAQQEVRALNADFADSETEALRKEWARLYKDLADLMIQEGRFSEAQAVLNMEKEQEAFEFLKRDAGAILKDTRAVLTDTEINDTERLRILAEAPVAAYELWRALDTELAEGGSVEQEDQLFLLEDAMAEAQSAYRAGVDLFLNEVTERDRAGFEAQFDATGSYQAILRARERPTAILQLAVLEEATHVFLTLPGATVHETIVVPKGDMRKAVFDALQAIERVTPGVEGPLARLYDLLLAPVRDALDVAGTEVIMVNAGDVLRYVPFAALHDGSDYVIRDFAFAQYIAAVPTNFVRPERKAESAAGFGVTQAHGSFSALPGVAFEIEALFAAEDGEGVLTGQTAMDSEFDARALRRALRNPPELLHIASHFALLPGQVDASFLLMGDGSQLSLSELSTSKFNFAGVDLLTLSACQTARGGDGSEIDGVGAAALKNGASAVMASLWPVADAATPILMHDFYRGLYADGLDKAEALRRAQIAMLDGAGAVDELTQRGAASLDEDLPESGFAHPYFWSAFLIMGNWL